MEKEEMKKYIDEKLNEADYIQIEMVYGLIQGLFKEQ